MAVVAVEVVVVALAVTVPAVAVVTLPIEFTGSAAAGGMSDLIRGIDQLHNILLLIILGQLEFNDKMKERTWVAREGVKGASNLHNADTP